MNLYCQVQNMALNFSSAYIIRRIIANATTSIENKDNHDSKNMANIVQQMSQNQLIVYIYIYIIRNKIKLNIVSYIIS